MNTNNLEYIGNIDNFNVYKNSEGFMEGYKKISNKIVNSQNAGTDVRRIVSKATTLEGFGVYIRGLKTKRSYKDIPLKPSQLPSLFTDEQ